MADTKLSDLTAVSNPVVGTDTIYIVRAGVSYKTTITDLPAATPSDGSITLAKLADLAQDQFIGRTTASTGVPQTATITAAARTVLDDTTVAAMLDTLGGASATGSGGVVRATSPTLVTPLLGTPTSGTLTNCTGLPTAGIVDAAVTLAKMANLAQDQFIGRTTASTGVPETATVTSAARTVLDDTTVAAMVDTLGGATSTGTGGIARATSPTFVTPVLGTPTSGTLTNCTIKAELGFACSDESTAVTAAVGKLFFRMPFAMTLTAVRASVKTAPTGSTLIIDINESGTTILSTKLSIDASEKTSTTAASAAVISDASLADDAEMSIDFDQVGSTIAGAGVKVWLIGTRS